MPKISVLMPVYNTKEEFLREAIESILSQTFHDFELIIVDNGSIEKTGNILKSYTDKRIKLYRLEENQGPAFARNYAVENAKGEFIIFHDSDDISFPERFEKQLQYFDKHSEVGCLGAEAKMVQDGVAKLRKNEFRSNEEIEAYLLLAGNVFVQSTVMIRRELLDKNCIRYNTDYVPAEDYKFWIDIIGKTKFAILSDVLLLYHFHVDNISSTRKIEQDKNTCLIRKENLEHLYGDSFPHAEVFLSFINKDKLSKEEIHILIKNMLNWISIFSKTYPREIIIKILKKRTKKLFYHTKDIKGQWRLLFSPLGKMFQLSIFWRLRCFITKGVL